jgi:hypothetical protein
MQHKVVRAVQTTAVHSRAGMLLFTCLFFAFIMGNSERLSRETASTSISRGSNATLSMPISDLERRLVTHRTLDIFTMKPKVPTCRLFHLGN